MALYGLHAYDCTVCNHRIASKQIRCRGRTTCVNLPWCLQRMLWAFVEPLRACQGFPGTGRSPSV